MVRTGYEGEDGRFGGSEEEDAEGVGDFHFVGWR